MSTVSHEILAAAITKTSEGMIVTDADQNIVFVNEAVEDLTGYAEREMLGRNCRFLQGERTDRATVAEIARKLTDGATFRGLILNYRRNGQEFWNDLTITPLLTADGTVTHFISVQRDSSELVALREDLRGQLETAQLLLDVSRLLSSYSTMTDVTRTVADGVRDICGADRSAVALWDASSEMLTVCAQSGWPSHLVDRVAAFSVSPQDLPELAILVATERPMLISADPSPPMQRLLREHDAAALVAMAISSHGEFRGVLLAYWDAPTPSGTRGLLEERLESLGHLAAVALENSSLLERAVWNGTHDTLTELPDRTLFEQSLHRKLRAGIAQSESVALLYLDIDRFKRANDTRGHSAGDEVLRYVASVLRSSTRESDFVARIGGDEFVVVLSHAHAAAVAEQVADRIRTQLDTPLSISGHDVFVSVSIGIAVSDTLDAAQTIDRQAETLTTAADASMYRNKASRSGVPVTPQGTEG